MYIEIFTLFVAPIRDSRTGLPPHSGNVNGFTSADTVFVSANDFAVYPLPMATQSKYVFVSVGSTLLMTCSLNPRSTGIPIHPSDAV